MTASNPVIFVVDDDAAVLRALERLLRGAGFDVRGFSSSAAFLQQHDPDPLGCAVLDIAMSGMNGLDLQRALATAGHGRPVIFLTGYGDIPMSVRAMKDGAVDFLTKPVDAQDLLAAIDRAVEKDRVNRQAGAQLRTAQLRLAALTPREREVLQHVVAGRLNKQIAAQLGTALKTIKVHRGRVMEKMAAGSVAELVRLSEQAGVEPFDMRS
jgi:FixJ family two-component response regulator